MPNVARKNMTDTVNSPHGTTKTVTIVTKSTDANGVVTTTTSTSTTCSTPSVQHTQEGSSDVLVNGIGAVRVGDKMTAHNNSSCSSHQPALSIGSSSVFVNGRSIARIGDIYGSDEIISSGSPNVFAGG